MECKFKYLREKLLICHYFSRKSYLHLSKKLDIKHLHKLNLKKNSPKKISSKLYFLYVWNANLNEKTIILVNFKIS